MLLDGRRFHGRLPCLFCRHARRRKTMAEWRDICAWILEGSGDEARLYAQPLESAA